MKITVDSYRDPFAALDLLSQQPGYDLVLVDIKMPSMNGLQFAKAARKADPPARIVLVTAHAMEQDETDALTSALKVDAIVAKPVTLAAFSALVGEQAPLIDAPA